MKTVNLEELDEKTSQWLRDAARYDQVVVTERGQPIATIQPARLASPTRKFGERKLLPCYYDDPGYEAVRRLADQDQLACCGHGRVELAAALHRKLRERALTA